MSIDQTPNRQGGTPISDPCIDDLVRGLDNLQWNLQVQCDILRLGKQAVPALVTFLHGPPNQFPDGRMLAAEALGRIGGEAAVQGLLAALAPYRLNALSPVLRLSEESVQDAIARQLGHLGDRRSVPALLEALRLHHLLGAAEALVWLHEVKALPWLVEGLEDAFKRNRLAQIIVDYGQPAVSYLADTLSRRRTRNGEELLPSLERRAGALKLLGLLGAKEVVSDVRAALMDSSDVVRIEAAIALATLDEDEEVLEAVPPLVGGLTHQDFLERDRCAGALVRIGPRCIPFIEQALRDGGVMVVGEAVPLTVNARMTALTTLERLKGHVPC